MLGASVAGTIGRVGWGGRWLVLGGVRGGGMCGLRCIKARVENKSRSFP